MNTIRRKIISQRKKLLKIIKKNNLIELKKYIKEEHIRNSFINYGVFFDILISAIENDASYDIIKFIINIWYRDVNYEIDGKINMNYEMTDSDEDFNVVELNNNENIIENFEMDDESENGEESEEEEMTNFEAYQSFFRSNNIYTLKKSPLIVSMKKNNLKVVDLLIEHGACIEDLSSLFFEDINISRKTMINILKRNIPINEDLIFEIIHYDNIWLLEKILKNNVYNTPFIIELLLLYRNKKELSKTQLENILNKGSKFTFNKNIYNETIEKYFCYDSFMNDYENDYYVLKLIYENDIRKKKVKLLDIYEVLNDQSTYKIKEFIDQIKNNQLRYTFDIEFLNTLEKYVRNKNIKQKIVKLIENNNFEGFKAFMEGNHIKFTDYKGEYNDLGLDYSDILKSIFYTEKSYPDKKIIKYLIESGADINIMVEFFDGFTTPLYEVISKNNIELAKYLIEWGAKVDVGIDFNVTPLYLAFKRDKELVKFIMGHVTTIDSGLSSYLLDCSLEEKDIDLAKCFIQHGADINKCRGLSIILESRRRQDFYTLNFTKEIIDKIGDVNIVHKSIDDLPLFIAIKNKDMEAIAYLVEKKGADVNIINKTGDCTPLGVAHNLKEINIIQYLINHGADINKAMYKSKFSLNIAIEHKDMKMIEYLIKCGVDVNVEFPSDSGNIYRNKSPLNTAIFENNMDIIKYLIDHGAKINNRSLLLASNISNLDFINYILGKEVEVNNGALNYAVRFDNLTLVKRLIEAGADANKENFYSGYEFYGSKKELSPLYIALKENNYEIVKFLINHGTIINMNDNDKSTHLIASIESGNDELVKYLIDWVISHNKKRNKLFIFTGNAYKINDNYNLNHRSMYSYINIENYLNNFVKYFNIKY